MCFCSDWSFGLVWLWYYFVVILDFYVEAIFFSTHVLIITSLSSERISNDEILRAQYSVNLPRYTKYS